MALHCPECGTDNPPGVFYCDRCESPLVPEALIPADVRRPAPAADQGGTATTMPPLSPASVMETIVMAGAGEQRYRIILGDTCPVCRAVSRISFTAERPPQIPIAGCQDANGCRCSLPIFASALEAALASPDATLSALAPERNLPLARPAAVETVVLEGAGAVPAPPPATPRRAVTPRPAVPAAPLPGTAEWSMAAPITQQRRRVLRELTDLYYQRRIQGIRILTASDCCRICAEVAAPIYEPTIAPTLPVVGCWHGWECRCLYGEEALPLDARGMEAMERLAAVERERQLRRRKVARGGPRWLHQAVVLVALVMAAGALLLRFDGANRPLWELVVPLVLAGLAAGVAMGAMRRLRPLSSPAWIYTLAGLLVAAVALYPLAGVHLPEGIWFMHLERLEQTTASPSLMRAALESLAHGHQILAAAGLVLLVLGLLDFALRSDEKAGG